MISQQVLFAQMELKLQQAKQAQSAAQMREALSALQVLCNVVLESSDDIENLSNMMQSTIPPQTLPPSSKIEKSAVIDDANGVSIFDF